MTQIAEGGCPGVHCRPIINPASKQLTSSAVFNAFKNKSRRLSVFYFQRLRGQWPRRACGRMLALLTRKIIYFCAGLIAIDGSFFFRRSTQIHADHKTDVRVSEDQAQRASGAARSPSSNLCNLRNLWIDLCSGATPEPGCLSADFSARAGNEAVAGFRWRVVSSVGRRGLKAGFAPLRIDALCCSPGRALLPGAAREYEAPGYLDWRPAGRN